MFYFMTLQEIKMPLLLGLIYSVSLLIRKLVTALVLVSVIKQHLLNILNIYNCVNRGTNRISTVSFIR
jgi:hypothetical protein